MSLERFRPHYRRESKKQIGRTVPKVRRLEKGESITYRSSTIIHETAGN
jgi:hypothetical protein